MDDTISRKTAYEVLSEYYHHKTETQHKALKEALDRVPSAQSENDDEVTFWKKRANEYEAMLVELTTKIAKGMTVGSMSINKDGIVFKESQPEPRWIPFTKRELTAEEQEEHPEWCYIMECPLPEENQEILVSNGKWVWLDTFCVDDGCYLDSDHELEGCAWMPLPDPWKGGAK